MIDSQISSFRPSTLDARHLRLVLAIVDEGGLTRAGERLNLTQSALSHQLKNIETSLGVTLFNRTRKRLVLTSAGEVLVARARQIVADIGALEDDLRQRASGWRGTLRIATECYTLYEWLPPLLKRFRRHQESVDVRIIADATSRPIDALIDGDLDLAIVSKRFENPAITYRPLFTDEVLLLVPREHRLAAKAYVKPSDLEKERLVLYSPPEVNHFYQHFFGRSESKPADIMAIKLTEAILSMVRAGLGVTACARWAVASELSTGRLVGVRLGPDGYRREWLGATRSSMGRTLPRYISDFMELMADAARPTRFSTPD